MDQDVAALKREKPEWTEEDIERLKTGEPLAYVIGNVPFLGVSVELFSHPLIPRPETEWWAELLCKHISDRPLRVLDLCAGSGAVGLAVLKHCPSAHVTFSELMEEHQGAIAHSIQKNGLDNARADICIGDVFTPLAGETFDIIATNPPYIPEGRELPTEVAAFEPHEALYAGPDGLAVIRRILAQAPAHMNAGGELWMECDIANIQEAQALTVGALRTEIRSDQYERPRVLLSYY